MLSTALKDTVPSLLSQYHRQHDMREVPIKIDLIRPMIENMGVVDKIYWEEFDYTPKGLLGQIEFYEGSMGVYAGNADYARIQFSATLNFCWKRFVIMKEMVHCIIDDQPNKLVSNVSDLSKLSQMLISEEYAALEDFDPHVTENYAEIIALEILFPFELRSYHRSVYDAGEVTDYQLALRYRIPERYARLAMMKGYYQAVEKIRSATLVAI